MKRVMCGLVLVITRAWTARSCSGKAPVPRSRVPEAEFLPYHLRQSLEPQG
jgi:hypothetical protein